METALIVMVREGFEAALIVAIVLTYLRRVGRAELSGAVWLGVAGAAALSFVFGLVVHNTVGSFEGVARMRANALIALTAAAVLTWMVFWMQRQARAIRGGLEHRIDSALASTSTVRALVAVAFVSVLREGIEAALFLVTAATSANGHDVFIGGVIGLTIAGVLGYMVYAGGRQLPMKQFFTVTGLIIIVFAAGLLAKSVMFLQPQGSNDLSSFDMSVYDLTGIHWLTTQSEVGRFLGALVGWDPRPSIEQVLVWVLYVVPVTYLFLRGPRPASRSSRAHAREHATAA
jgi:high-affinity iron transporter